MADFQVGKSYSFKTLAPTVLGIALTNQLVKGIVDYTTANQVANIDLVHRTVYPLLPVGTIDNPKQYRYLLLRSDSGATSAIAMEWIDLSTVVEAVSLSIVVTIPIATADDSRKIRDTLTLMGYQNFTIAMNEITG